MGDEAGPASHTVISSFSSKHNMLRTSVQVRSRHNGDGGRGLGWVAGEITYGIFLSVMIYSMRGYIYVGYISVKVLTSLQISIMGQGRW